MHISGHTFLLQKLISYYDEMVLKEIMTIRSNVGGSES